MKKLLLTLVLGLLLSGNTFAETKVIDRYHEKSKNGKSNMFSIYTLCIDGYKFIYTYVFVKNPSTTMTQFFEERDGKSLPAKC